MKQYQTRALSELEDIKLRIQRLEKFKASKDYADLDTIERQLLVAQQHGMLSYQSALQMRIDLWAKK